MATSREEMMELLAKLLAEYAEFQRLRPDLPQGDLRDVSEQGLALKLAPSLLDLAEQGEEITITRRASPRKYAAVQNFRHIAPV